MNIVYVNKETAPIWDDYIRKHDFGSFYQLYGWKEINEKCFQHECSFIAAMERGSVVGALPVVFINSRLFGKILCSMPFVNYGGACANDHQAEEILLDEVRKVMTVRKADYCEIRETHLIGSDLPVSSHKVSMTLSLQSDPDIIWNAFNTKHRRDIRRGYKNGLTCVSGGQELLDSFYSVISEGWRNLGTPIYRKSYFKKILETFPDSVRLFVVSHDGMPVAAALNGYFKGTVEGMWLGIRKGYSHLYVNYVLYWEMIKDACEREFTTFHFGRSSVGSGGEFFKKKWLAEPRQLYWQYLLKDDAKIPQLNVNNPKYRIFIAAWKRLPVPVANRIGPLISGGIP